MCRSQPSASFFDAFKTGGAPSILVSHIATPSLNSDPWNEINEDQLHKDKVNEQKQEQQKMMGLQTKPRPMNP